MVVAALLALSAAAASRLAAEDRLAASIDARPLDTARSDANDGPPPAPPGPHPLLPALKIAYESYRYLNDEVRDYACRVVKSERVDGRARPMEFIDVKVRHEINRDGQVIQRRAVYLNYVAPEAVAGRQILWVDGQYDGDLIVRRGGRRFNYITVVISPDSETVRRESNYLITDMGLKAMVRNLIDIGLSDMKYGECEVDFFKNVKVDGDECTCIQV
ncbi:MAG: DUF1571 domain-containing protein, partial [Planctomycetales bacterium]|nr:DUF1571 domain-containing protein [Planctomycetales bacterium]